MPNVLSCIKAAPGRVELARIDLPDPGPGQALIRTTLSTICGSDLHIRDDIPEVPAGMPMGHEGGGRDRGRRRGRDPLQARRPGRLVLSAKLRNL